MHELIINKNRQTKIIKTIKYQTNSITKIIKVDQFHLKESSIFYYPSYMEKKWRNLILMFSLSKISKEILLDNLNKDFKNNNYICMLINYYVKLKTEWVNDFENDEIQKMKSDITYLVSIYIQYYGTIIFGQELMKKVLTKVHAPILPKILNSFHFSKPLNFILTSDERKLLIDISTMSYTKTIDECFAKIDIKKWNSYDELKYFNLERAAIATIKKKAKREQYFGELKQDVINRLLLYFSNYHINDLTSNNVIRNL